MNMFDPIKLQFEYQIIDNKYVYNLHDENGVHIASGKISDQMFTKFEMVLIAALINRMHFPAYIAEEIKKEYENDII